MTTVTQAGNFGIGVNPTQKLHVKSSGNSTSPILVEASGSANPLIALNQGAAGNGIVSVYDAAGVEGARINGTAAAANSFITSDLGVGNNAPTEQLDVTEILPTQAKFGPIGNQPIFLVANQPMVGFNAKWDMGLFNYAYGSTAPAGIVTFGQEVLGGFSINTAPSGTAGTVAPMVSRIAIENTGNVGIGTTSPTTKLEVAGQVK